MELLLLLLQLKKQRILINMVKEIKEQEFKNVIESNEKVVVDCFATWCGPCKMLAPIVDAISEEKKDYAFYKMDIIDCMVVG